LKPTALLVKLEQKEFLSVATPPARLGINETAWLLGFTEQDIPVLLSTGLLKPLGHPPASGSKYFATVELQNLRIDTRRLAKASDAIVNHWRKKNCGRGPNTTATF
jgi:hypothetical protein